MESFAKVFRALLAAAVTWVCTFVVVFIGSGVVISIITGRGTINGWPATVIFLAWWGPPVLVFVKVSGIWDAIVCAQGERSSATNAKLQAALEAKERRRTAVEMQKAPFAYQLEDVPKFFGRFMLNANPKGRDKFETEAEYRKRLPAAVNPDQCFYFLLMQEEFLYSVEENIATIVSASGVHGDRGTLILLREKERPGKNTWTNVFGAEASIAILKEREYEIIIHNPRKVPRALRCKAPESFLIPARFEYIKCSVTMDRAYAREHEQNLRLVAGVTFIDWKRCEHKHSHEEPEFGSSLETYWDKYQLDGNIASIHLINTETVEQLRGWALR